MKNVCLGLTTLALIGGCGSSPAIVPAPPMVSPTPIATAAPTSDVVLVPAPVEDDPAKESTKLIAQMLDKVAKARGLPIKRPVPGKVLDRDAIGARIREMVAKETPKSAILAQGDALAALEMVPADYDFFNGSMALMGGRVAGYYDPKETLMVLAGDLSDEEAQETLAHELAHALVDQSFSLAPHVEYHPGEGDKSSAVHAFIEGDATSTMLDVSIGSAFDMDEEAVRMAFVASTLLSGVGAKTPRAINSSLIAPYVDGFACIQALRRLGDWAAVDEVWHHLPETTEQLLHIDKLLAREPAEIIAPPSLGPLEKAGYRVVVEDVFGEQGLRILFEDVTTRSKAKEAAAGWGGDRYVVAEREENGNRQTATILRLRMDTAIDATEVADQFRVKYGKACHERDKIGPVAWELKGRDLLLVAGPFERTDAGPKAIGTCRQSKAWLAEAWKAAPAVKVGAEKRATK